jgi:integrating conjugative element protein (TIGR03765 family)
MRRINLFLIGAMLSLSAQASPLIVVEDHGGVSALPYYRVFKSGTPRLKIAKGPIRRGEAAMLPVKSARLTPGAPSRKNIKGVGAPFFLVGDDPSSRAWLLQSRNILRGMSAAGLVVNVETFSALEALRRLAPGLQLSPVSGDDLARRYGVKHYPVLLVPVGINQRD